MKLRIVVSIVLILCSILFLFAGCASDIKTFKGVINKIDGLNVYITPNENEDISLLSKNMLINLKNEKIKLKVGDKVVVTYTDEVAQTEPLQANLKYIEKIQE